MASYTDAPKTNNQFLNPGALLGNIFDTHQGSWSIGGYKLPDFGITEFIKPAYASDDTPQWVPPSNNAQPQNVITSDLPATGGTPLQLQQQSQPAATTSGSAGNNNQGLDLKQISQGFQPGENQAMYDARIARDNQTNQLRNDISSGWDRYLGTLDDLMNNGLTGQRSAQENIAREQLNQGKNTLGLQQTQGLQSLEAQRTKAGQNQSKNLKDLSSNLRNSFLAGNVYLGARGAGDSSAANQYAYALTKEGNKQRADVMNNTSNIYGEIDARETNLRNIVDTETRNLESGYNQQINQVANWFAGEQNKLKQAIASGQLGKSQDLAALSRELLNQGLQQVQQIQQNAQNQYNALTQWATNNAKTIEGLKANLSAVSQYAPQMPGISQIAGTPQVDSGGNFRVPTGYGATSSNDQTDLFGNPIRA